MIPASRIGQQIEMIPDAQVERTGIVIGALSSRAA
jgi:hypothetical protein